MNKKVAVITLVVIAILIVIFGIYQSKKANTEVVAPVVPDTTVENPNASPSAYRITVKHQYKNPTHTIVGEMDLPTPCHTLGYTVSRSLDGKKATIAFTTTAAETVCAQVITTRRFKVQFNGSSDMTYDATLNGAPLILNVFEANAAEDLDAFEVEIKG